MYVELLGLKSVPTVKVGPFRTSQEDEDRTAGRCSQRVSARRPIATKVTQYTDPGQVLPVVVRRSSVDTGSLDVHS